VPVAGGLPLGVLPLAIPPVSATAARRQALAARVRHFFKESDGTYGYRRIHADLAGEGTECSPELVRQIMRQEALVPCQPRPFRTTTVADAEAAEAMPDLVKRDFTAARPGIKFVGDITYSAQSTIMCGPVAWVGRRPFPASSQRYEALIYCT
jgi:transposase InsO family protein